ncbi:lasso peptide [Fischerella thermalis]|nr:lasso peptide [Fischerella thermalis]
MHHHKFAENRSKIKGVTAMKKTYIAPKLIAHGSVETITNFSGNRTRTDFVFFNGDNNAGLSGPVNLNGSLGSIDHFDTPCPENPSRCK